MVYTFEIPTLNYMSFIKIAVTCWKFDSNVKEKILTSLPGLSDMFCLSTTLHLNREDPGGDLWRLRTPLTPVYDNPCGKFMNERWAQAEKIVGEKIVGLPKNMEVAILNLIKLVGTEIRDWLMYLQYYVLGISGTGTDWTKLVKLIDFTEWTPYGKIDELRTVDAILSQNEDLTRNEKFQIACAYCLEDKIAFFWRQISLESKEFYIHPPFVNDALYLVKFWINEIQNRNSQPEDHTRMLELVVRCDHLTAAQYFWSRATPENRLRSVLSMTHYFERVFKMTDRRRGAAIMCFFLSRMSRNDLIAVLARTDFAFIVERLFSDWTCVEFYLQSLIKLYPCANETKFYHLLRKIAGQMTGFQGDRHKEFFRELWQKASNKFKMSVTRHETSTSGACCCTKMLFQARDLENLYSFLDHVTLGTRRQIFLKCLHRIHELDWDFYEQSVCELVKSDEEMKTFKSDCADVAFAICLKLVANNNHQVEAMEKFLRFCLLSPEKIKKLRRTLLCELPRDLPLYGGKQLELMDKLLDRKYFSEKEVTNFKKSFIYEYSEVIPCITNELLSENKNPPVLGDLILEWCLFTPEEIVDFKKQRIGTSGLVADKLVCWIEERNWELLEKCLEWCFFKDV